MMLRLRSARRRDTARAVVRRRARRGFGLVEIIVAMTLLAVVLSSLAALAFQASRQSRVVGTGGNRTAVLADAFNRYSAISYNKLPADGTTTTSVTGAFRYSLTIAAATDPANSNHRIITVTVTPTDPLIRATSVVIERWRPSTANPLASNSAN